MKRRVISFCMCVVMCVTMLPMKTWAEIKSNKSLYASNSNEVEGSAIDYNYFLEKNDSIHNLYGSQKTASAFNPEGWLWPVKDNRAVYSPYNVGFSNLIAKRGREHKGIDISYNGDLLIFAAKAGTVIEVYNSCTHIKVSGDTCGGGFGNHVKIRHDDGSISIYGHMKKDSIVVTKNQTVRQGQPLGITGASGSASGIHLHFSILFNNAYVNVNPKSNKYITSNNKGQYSNQEICSGGIIEYIYDATLYERLTPLTKPFVQTDKSSYLAGETVSIQWDAVANNEMYAINVYKNDVLIYEAGLNETSYTLTNATVGNYVIYVSANNSAGTSGVSSCSFTVVGVPETPIVSTSSNRYWAGETITASWNAVAFNDQYAINIYKDNVLIYEAGLYDTSYTITNAAAGNYVIYVSANNAAGTSGVSSCSFSVEQPYMTYDANGGTGATEPQAFNMGGGYYLSTIVPKREGYAFVNWRDTNNGLYFNPGDAIPSDWGSDTMVAQWQPNYCYLDLSCYLDGVWTPSLAGYATVDVSIGGGDVFLQIAVDDFYGEYPYGTSYEIKNISIADGFAYDGIVTGTRTGTLTDNTAVALSFHSILTSLPETPKEGTFDGHTYYYFSTPVTWYDAKSICEHMGGHLVTITSAEENAFILNLAGDSPYVWLGATDVGTEGTFQWITGEPFTYGTWLSGQPDNYALNAEGAENYLHIYDSTGVWNDNCGCAQMMFVCEIEPKEFSVAYDSNGGSGAMNAMTGKYGEVLTLTQNSFTRVGYTFAGWNMKRDSDGRWYTESDDFVTDGEITTGLVKRLYANGADVCFTNYDGSDGYTFVAIWTRDFIQGNVNGSDTADVTDMACLFDYLSAGKLSGAYQNDSAYFKAVADVNEDGTVNILDYQALYELVRSGA